MVVVSTKTRLYMRIMEAMYDDAEVVAMCQAEIDRAKKSAEKTADRLATALSVIKFFTDPEKPVCAKDFARKVNQSCGENWNTRTASYYLRELVKQGVVEEVEVEAKSAPKHYVYVG